ncbi:MAG: hypothetical protein JJ892_08665 [Balneola sp.]|nr:hypothetical protein [Balneola sp.]MBO6650272.1 hypothetical protein [Balneola sp.]MBO6712142.1 hypothetical protein [Balneola sp.]MBO6800336.1 hypothetical protein [Balneola sp.]MBO6869650.1 hypothetical protein [Balneola sp.]
MKLLLVGHLAISTKLIIALKKTGVHLSVLSTENQNNSSEKSKNDLLSDITYLGRFYEHFKLLKPKYTRFLFSLAFLIPILPKALFRKLHSVLETNKPDIIIGNWGTGILPEINLIKSMDSMKETKTILNMETFPTTWNSGTRELFERYLLKSSMKNIDGMIVPTKEMYDLLLSYNLPVQEKIVYQKPFYFPRSHFNNAQNHTNAVEKKDLIFLGKPDLFRSLNSVQNQLLEMAESGITLSCSKNFKIKHKNIHTFEPFNIYDSKYDFSEITNTHKAALVTFQISERIKYPLRFSTSLPHRFLFPLALGLPAVVPEQGFEAIGNLIDKYKIGFRFGSTDKLKDYLYSEAVSVSKTNILKNQSELDFNPDDFKLFLTKFI